MKSDIKNPKQVPLKSVTEFSGKKRIPAAHTPLIHLTEEEIVSLKQKEAATQKWIGNLLDRMRCNDSKNSELDNINKTEDFDMNNFV